MGFDIPKQHLCYLRRSSGELQRKKARKAWRLIKVAPGWLSYMLGKGMGQMDIRRKEIRRRKVTASAPADECSFTCMLLTSVHLVRLSSTSPSALWWPWAYYIKVYGQGPRILASESGLSSKGLRLIRRACRSNS